MEKNTAGLTGAFAHVIRSSRALTQSGPKGTFLYRNHGVREKRNSASGALGMLRSVAGSMETVLWLTKSKTRTKNID